MTVQLRILGPVQMNVHDEEVVIASTKVRGLLGVLAYRSNEPVSSSYLADALWDDDRPPNPPKTLQTYASRLRRALNESGFPAAVTNDNGAYRIAVESSNVDYKRFRILIRDGHQALGRSAHKRAAELFTTAVGLWRGPPLADVKTSWAQGLQDSLIMRDLLPAHCALFDAKLALGDVEFVMDRMPALLSGHPHDDGLAELWMRVLTIAHRSHEVEAFFRDHCQRLKANLDGVPSPKLIQAYQNSSKSNSTTDRPTRPLRVPPPPRDTPSFTGRAELLTRLDTLLLGPERAASVVALDGRPGVGKTALIRRWAHSRQSHFPDGMLHLDLNGYSHMSQIEPATVVSTFLDDLGVLPARVAKMGVDDRMALLRHTLTGRRSLIVLDNVRDSQHVRPLLAATGNCPVVITSRQRLTSVAVHDGAEHVTVPALTDDEAATLLQMRIGRRAVDEPEAVDELVALCDRLPLAIWIVGEHVAARPEVSVHDLAGELQHTRRLLDAGSHGDDDSPTLRSAFSWSYGALRPREREVFQRLGFLPGVRFSVEAAAAVSGLHRGDVDQPLDALVGAHLVEQERAGRFRMHDLLHRYATDRAQHDEPLAARDGATRRLLDWYVGTARNARHLLTVDPHEIPELPAAEPVEPLTFGSVEQAKRWFDLERSTVVALARRAATFGHHEAVWRLAACLHVPHDYDLPELLEIHELGRASAALLGEQRAVGGCLSNKGTTYGRLDDNVHAGECFEQAYESFKAAGDTYGQAVSQHNLGAVRLRLGHPLEAIMWHRQALDAFAATGDEWAIANVRRWRGDDCRELYRLDEANEYYRDSLELSRKLADHRGQGATLSRLAQLNLDTGRPDLAISTGREGVDAHDRIGDRGGVADILCLMALAHGELNAHGEAVAAAGEAAQIYAEMRNTTRQAHALEILGNAQAAAGEHHHAAEAWTAAAEVLGAQEDTRANDLRARAAQVVECEVPVPRSDATLPAPPKITAAPDSRTSAREDR
ncbi:MAG TPA: BTAD domain-containing putative transcriptional regulator [Actinophytocola sp.]|nr:BTAD domain-containing putative transcriptional regulator [Actinophytocola sp.]